MLKLRHIWLISLLFTATVYASSGDTYADRGQGRAQRQGQVQRKGGANVKARGTVNRSQARVKNPQVNAVNVNRARFANTDSVTINRYYRARPFPVTTLPPGIARNLVRGQPLPPGIARVYLPPDLVAQLPVRTGYDYLVAGRDVVLVNTSTGVVDDILVNALQ